MRSFALLLIGLLSALLTTSPLLAQGVCPSGQMPVPTDSGLYGLGGGGPKGHYGCSDIPGNLTPPKFGPGSGGNSSFNDDPWDYSGISISVSEPSKLKPTEMSSGKPYRVTLPRGQTLNVFDTPGGYLVGRLTGQESEVRARYYYAASVNNVWAGVCASNGPCGWVSADYLFSLPAGARSQGVYRVIVPEIYAFDQPNVNGKRLGSIFADNRVVVIGTQSQSDGEWSRVCRLQSCGWVSSEFIAFDY